MVLEALYDNHYDFSIEKQKGSFPNYQEQPTHESYEI